MLFCYGFQRSLNQRDQQKVNKSYKNLIPCCSVFNHLSFLAIETYQLRNSTSEDKVQKMQNYHLLLIFLFLNFLICSSITQNSDSISCDKFQNQAHFPLNHMILCRSDKLYFRTSIGLFPISKIDYITKTLIISHSISSSTHFVSPSILSLGLPSPPNLINSLFLFHCQNPTTKPITQNCTNLHKFEQESTKESCLIFEDLGNLSKNFHPNQLKCSHYEGVHRNYSSGFDLRNGYKIGSVVSFDIPQHVPNLCNECEKPDGHCGVGLRCLCHVLQCKDKVFSEGGIIRPGGKFLLSLPAVIVMIILLI